MISITFNGRPVSKAVLHAGQKGVAWIELDYVDSTAPTTDAPGLRFTDDSGGALLTIAAVEIADRSGDFVQRRKARAVLGAGGWRKSVAAKPYHSDAGVDPKVVIQEAAADSGETIALPSSLPPIGIDYNRRAAPATAADAIEDASSAAGVIWWVDLDGVTRVAAARPAIEAPKARLLDYNPRTRSASLSCDSPADIVVGSVIRDDRLTAPLTVAALIMTIEGSGIRVDADTGPQETDQLTDAFLALVRRELARNLWGHYRYRVVSRSAPRVALQAVSTAPGLPDQIAVTIWPGVPGFDGSQPKLSTEVLVAFEDGDKRKPFVSHFVNATPAQQLIAQKGNEQPAARKGDVVTILLPPLVIAGTIGGTQFTGIAQASLGQTLGSITTGSEAFTIGDGSG